MKFKTNAKCKGCEQAIKMALGDFAPVSEWEMDLTSPDKVLTYKGGAKIDPAQVVAAIKAAGFQAETLS